MGIAAHQPARKPQAGTGTPAVVPPAQPPFTVAYGDNGIPIGIINDAPGRPDTMEPQPDHGKPLLLTVDPGYRMGLPDDDAPMYTVVDDAGLLDGCVQAYRAGRYPFIVNRPDPVLFVDTDPGAIIRVREEDRAGCASMVAPVPRVVFDLSGMPGGEREVVGSLITERPVEQALLLMVNAGPIRIEAPILGEALGARHLMVRTRHDSYRVGSDWVVGGTFRLDYACSGLFYQDRATLARRVVWLTDNTGAPSSMVARVEVVLAENIPAALERWINEAAVGQPRLLALETTRVVHGDHHAVTDRGIVDILALDLATVWMNPDGSTAVTMVYFQQPIHTSHTPTTTYTHR